MRRPPPWLCCALLLWLTVPHAYVGVAWCALALLLFELGNWKLPAEMRWMAWPVAAAGAVGLVVTHDQNFTKFAAGEVWISYLGAALAAWVAVARTIAPPAVPAAGRAPRHPSHRRHRRPVRRFRVPVARACRTRR